jgi:hypothetical protein
MNWQSCDRLIIHEEAKWSAKRGERVCRSTKHKSTLSVFDHLALTSIEGVVIVLPRLFIEFSKALPFCGEDSCDAFATTASEKLDLCASRSNAISKDSETKSLN